MTGTRVFIYGSCVSRDTFSAMPQDRYALVDYVARQSIISAARPPIAYPLDLSAVSSRFQQRMVQGAQRGNLYESLRQHAAETDLVLVDLTDERAGVFEMPDGSYFTRSIELDGAGLTRQVSDASTRYLQFGTDEHFEVFGWAAQTFRAELDRLGLTERTVVLAPAWAEYTIDGQYSGESYGYSPSDANYFQQRYVDLLENYLGLRTLRLTDTRSDAGHQWGLAPFHFAEPVYAYFVDKLAEVAPAPRESTGSQGSKTAGTSAAVKVESVRARTSALPSVVLVQTASTDGGMTAYLDSVVGHAISESMGMFRVVAQDGRRIGSGTTGVIEQIERIDGAGAARIFVAVGEGTLVAAELAKADRAAPLVALYPHGLDSFDPGVTPVHVFMSPAHFRAHYPTEAVDKAIASVALLTKSGSVHSLHDQGALTQNAVQQIMELVGEMTEVKS